MCFLKSYTLVKYLYCLSPSLWGRRPRCSISWVGWVLCVSQTLKDYHKAGNKPQKIIKEIQNTVHMYIWRKHDAFSKCGHFTRRHDIVHAQVLWQNLEPDIQSPEPDNTAPPVLELRSALLGGLTFFNSLGSFEPLGEHKISQRGWKCRKG